MAARWRPSLLAAFLVIAVVTQMSDAKRAKKIRMSDVTDKLVVVSGNSIVATSEDGSAPGELNRGLVIGESFAGTDKNRALESKTKSRRRKKKKKKKRRKLVKTKDVKIEDLNREAKQEGVSPALEAKDTDNVDLQFDESDEFDNSTTNSTKFFGISYLTADLFDIELDFSEVDDPDGVVEEILADSNEEDADLVENVTPRVEPVDAKSGDPEHPGTAIHNESGLQLFPLSPDLAPLRDIESRIVVRRGRRSRDKKRPPRRRTSAIRPSGGRRKDRRDRYDGRRQPQRKTSRKPTYERTLKRSYGRSSRSPFSTSDEDKGYRARDDRYRRRSRESGYDEAYVGGRYSERYTRHDPRDDGDRYGNRETDRYDTRDKYSGYSGKKVGRYNDRYDDRYDGRSNNYRYAGDRYDDDKYKRYDDKNHKQYDDWRGHQYNDDDGRYDDDRYDIDPYNEKRYGYDRQYVDDRYDDDRYTDDRYNDDRYNDDRYDNDRYDDDRYDDDQYDNDRYEDDRYDDDQYDNDRYDDDPDDSYGTDQDRRDVRSVHGNERELQGSYPVDQPEFKRQGYGYKPKKKKKKYHKKVPVYVPIPIKKKKKKMKIIAIFKGFRVAGGQQVAKNVKSLKQCMKICGISANCFSGDYNKWTYKCYLHDQDTGCDQLQAHPKVTHFQKIPCELNDLVTTEVTLGMQAFGGIVQKGVKSLTACLKVCEKIGGANADPADRRCFGIDYDFATHKCYIFARRNLVCQNNDLEPNASVVNIRHCNT